MFQILTTIQGKLYPKEASTWRAHLPGRFYPKKCKEEEGMRQVGEETEGESGESGGRDSGYVWLRNIVYKYEVLKGKK